MKINSLMLKILCTAAALQPSSAFATVYYFNVVGSGTASTKSASFSIDTSTTLPSYVNNTGITYNSITGIYNGITASSAVQFFNTTSFGGINIGRVGSGYGPMMYSGDPNAPVFTIGTFSTLNQPGINTGFYTITISDVAPAVPEPASWAMMIVGFGAIGVASRYRRRSVTTAGA